MEQVLIASVPCLYLLNTEIPRVFYFLFDAITLCFTLKLQHTEGAGGPQLSTPGGQMCAALSGGEKQQGRKRGMFSSLLSDAVFAESWACSLYKN